jgi:myosin protein heavy chain
LEEKIQETVKDLENQLEEEEQARQKMLLDKKNVENRLKELQDRLSQIQDSYDRLQAEKRSIEDKYSQLSNQLMEEEEKSKQSAKFRKKVILFILIQKHKDSKFHPTNFYIGKAKKRTYTIF